MKNIKPLLEVHDLKKWFPVKKNIFAKKTEYIKAVDNISFHIESGETFALVGESGCGKTTAGRTLLRLLEPTKGQVFFEGEDIFKLSKNKLRFLRQKMQIIFQDPYSSLNPRLNVLSLIGEALKVHDKMKGKKLRDKVIDLLEKVGLLPEHLYRFPHEFSGGQRQRLGIARALALNPKFIVCDEVVSALDVSIQAQVINLLQDLQKDLGIAYLFISHDLSVVKHISSRIGVMYLGRIVEIGPCEELFKKPKHPYTQSLLDSIPRLKPQKEKRNRLSILGDIPNPINPPSGCHFHPRCTEALPQCKTGDFPQYITISSDHKVACHLYSK